ncbi:MAG: hypothetical protein CSA26_00110 [Desulfobacterales bacterium]|nr:MAG: hypothetical protein CSA26_00110 [Desulfobacterales bacterium]
MPAIEKSDKSEMNKKGPTCKKRRCLLFCISPEFRLFLGKWSKAVKEYGGDKIICRQSCQDTGAYQNPHIDYTLAAEAR